jgi:hypothetical protein
MDLFDFLYEKVAAELNAKNEPKKKVKVHMTKGVIVEHGKQQAESGAGTMLGTAAGFLAREALRGKGGNPKEKRRVGELLDKQIAKLEKKRKKTIKQRTEDAFTQEQAGKLRRVHGGGTPSTGSV